MALFKIFNNIDNPQIDPTTGEPKLPTTYNKGYMYFDANTNIFYIDTSGPGGETGTRVKLNSWGAYKAFRSEGIPYGVVDSTSTSTNFTATVPGITGLEDGTIMLLKNGKVTSAANFTININGLGGKPVYTNMAAQTPETTIFNKDYTMLFIYDSTRVPDGCWICYRGYDSNTNTIGYQVRTNGYSLPMDSTVYRYRLLFTSADGTKFVPANNSTAINGTTAVTPVQTPIDPFGSIVYYGTTTVLAANSRPAATILWQQYTVTLGYSFNQTGGALTLTSWKPVYLKCTPQSNGSAIIDSTTPYVQDLPTTADGKIYIFLGVAYSPTAMELTLNHPVYYHNGTSINFWTGTTNAETANQLTHTLTIGNYTFNGSEDVSIPVYDGTYTQS